jgi:hypothetical protein
MKHKTRWAFSLFLLWGMLCVSFAQEGMPASGGQASGEDGNVGYSVGQLFVSSHEGTGGSIQEGVHQPYEISVVTELPETKHIELNFSVYPNPASEFLYLTIKDFSEKENWICRLYDGQGNLLQADNVYEARKTFDLKSLPPGVYFLKVFNAERDSSVEVKTFKVLKK